MSNAHLGFTESQQEEIFMSVHNKKNVGKKGLGFSGSNFKDDEEEKPATETLTGSAKLSAMRAAFQKQFQPSGVAEQKKEEEKVPFANLEKPKTHVTFDEDDDTPKQETKRDSESESSSSEERSKKHRHSKEKSESKKRESKHHRSSSKERKHRKKHDSSSSEEISKRKRTHSDKSESKDTDKRKDKSHKSSSKDKKH